MIIWGFLFLIYGVIVLISAAIFRSFVVKSRFTFALVRCFCVTFWIVPTVLLYEYYTRAASVSNKVSDISRKFEDSKVSAQIVRTPISVFRTGFASECVWRVRSESVRGKVSHTFHLAY